MKHERRPQQKLFIGLDLGDDIGFGEDIKALKWIILKICHPVVIISVVSTGLLLMIPICAMLEENRQNNAWELIGKFESQQFYPAEYDKPSRTKIVARGITYVVLGKVLEIPVADIYINISRNGLKINDIIYDNVPNRNKYSVP